jgi:phage tail-like protein
MAGPHEPFEASNFLVDYGGAGGATLFSHVDLPVAVLDEIAYRSGNDRANEPRKQPGLASYSHLVLTRGMTADLDLWTWWETTRNGAGADRDVVVRLLDGTGQLLLTWMFRNAFPAVYRVSPLDAASSDALLETLELAFDTMDIEAS